MAIAAMSRALISSSSRSPLTLFLFKRFFFHPPGSSGSSSSSPLIRFRLAVRVVDPAATQLNQIRCWVNQSGRSGGYTFSKRWFIIMDKPGGEGATWQQMIDCYIQTLAKVLGSEEKAKKKIYNVSCERDFGFGCEIDEETSNKLKGIPGVLSVRPDVDAENKDYGRTVF